MQQDNENENTINKAAAAAQDNNFEAASQL